MSLWNEVLLLGSQMQEKIKLFYQNRFYVEVREQLADWIESKLICVTSSGDPTTQCAIDSTHFMTDFIAEIEKRAAVMTSEDIGNGRTKFLECAKSFRQLNPNDVITYLRRGLEFEIKIVTEMDRKFKGTFKHIEKLMMLVQANDEACSSLSQLYREFNIDFHAATRNISYWNDMITQNPDFYQTFEEQRIAQRLHIQKSSDQVTAAKLEMVEKFKTVLTLTADVQQIKVFEYLNQWHFNRVQEENGNKSNFINLDVIQSWFENIARILWRTCEQLKAVMALKQHPSVDESLLQGLLDKSNELLVNHIKKSFIVEKQPPQVLKTNTRFATSLRFLIGNVLTNEHNVFQPYVKASIVSDLQAKQLHMTAKFNGGDVGILQNNTEHFVFNELTREMSASYRKMELKRIKRAEKKSTDESVMNEKLALVFESSFIVGSLNVAVWTLSLPIVVIVHGNQEPKSWATITWDNAFAEVNREPFDVPEKVLWSRLAEVLKIKFHAETGCDLTTDNLLFLCEKAFNQSLPNKRLPDNLWISLSQFYKEPLPGRLFTFWEWFFAAMRLTRIHLRGPWKDGLVCGFISKLEAESNLTQCVDGTFLLRFSDSELGAISIARVSKVKETLHVLHVQPLSTKHFALLSLADRVLSSEELTIIHPNVEKTTALKKYETQKSKPKDGYVEAIIVMSIINNNGSHSLASPDLQNNFLSEQPGNLALPMSVDLPEDWCNDLMMNTESLPGFTDIWKNEI